MKLREQGGLDPLAGLVSRPQVVAEGFNNVIGGHPDMGASGLDQLQHRVEHAGHRAIGPVSALGEAAQAVEVPEQLVGPIEKMNDHAAGRRYRGSRKFRKVME